MVLTLKLNTPWCEGTPVVEPAATSAANDRVDAIDRQETLVIMIVGRENDLHTVFLRQREQQVGDILSVRYPVGVVVVVGVRSGAHDWQMQEQKLPWLGAEN